jgi:hypothetical protein
LLAQTLFYGAGVLLVVVSYSTHMLSC